MRLGKGSENINQIAESTSGQRIIYRQIATNQ
jgi:hypothetical protein